MVATPDTLSDAQTRQGDTAPEVSTETALRHYHLCCLSRECSKLARKEVLTGKAKFGIIGDGKELPQVALATQFEPGDWRSGYYRDQTLMMALDLCSVEQFFAQLYADPQNDPFSGGRQMNSHFATPTVRDDGSWLPLKQTLNISADISSTAGQMARGLGLALASQKYRRLPAFEHSQFSNEGREIAWVTIGDASTSEGAFWEALNAAGVMQVPMVVSVWDDGYGISVPTKYQTTKSSISKAVAGLQRNENEDGVEIIRVRAWDYVALLSAYERAARMAREDHVPVLVHVTQVTQQLGHSTSGSHERYKSKERLAFETEYDCNARFREWLIAEDLATPEELDLEEKRAAEAAKAGAKAAWDAAKVQAHEAIEEASSLVPAGSTSANELANEFLPTRAGAVAAVRRELIRLRVAGQAAPEAMEQFVEMQTAVAREDFSSNLYLEGPGSALAITPEAAEYGDAAPNLPGFQLLNQYFDSLLERDARVLAFGEDVGHIGDVNQGFAGLQEKYGEERVFDTGIREWTIVGQAIGLALRGLRPIAEIQYLDYLVYALSPLTDDLATTLYRTDGQQRCPAIIRTRGHRLEGIWHSGSPLGMIINSLRGMHVCVPRNMLQAVGMYNTLMQAEEPALVIETLNAYRLRERVPTNLATYTVALGQPEVLHAGADITVVTYGACVNICLAALELLGDSGPSVELIDVQTLLPFDVNGIIGDSLARTNRLLIVDEDVPGGASGYILAQLMNEQKVFTSLDAEPVLLTAQAHRPPFGSDGDYFSKPSAEDVAERVLEIVGE